MSVLGYEVDAFFADTKTVVELDGWETHKTRRAFEHDRAKAATLEGAGYRVKCFTWRQVSREPDMVAAAVRGA